MNMLCKALGHQYGNGKWAGARKTSLGLLEKRVKKCERCGHNLKYWEPVGRNNHA